MYTVDGNDKDPAFFIKIKTDPIDIESEMKGYVKKSLHFLMHGSAGSILVEIEKSTILTQFFRIEIVKKSIFEKLKKIETELQNRNY